MPEPNRWCQRTASIEPSLPGDSAGSLSARLAFALETALYPEADLLADLHSGDCNEALHPLVFFPTAGEEIVNQVSLAAAKVLTVLPGTFHCEERTYSWAVQRGVPALLIERGGQGLWSEQEVDACCEDVRSLLRHLEIMPGGTRRGISWKSQKPSMRKLSRRDFGTRQ